MILLTMAHKGEAKYFIKMMGFKSVDQVLYTTTDPAYDNYLLLITGEGILNTLTRIPYYLAKYEVKEIINFGTAGALTNHLTYKDVYPVKLVYGYNESLLFHSYPSSIPKKNALTCISSDKRVDTEDLKQILSYHAEIVDRELWAIAKVAKEYKIPYHCYKIISDYANERICDLVKEEALEYSKRLFTYFNDLKIDYKTRSKEVYEFNFHCSFSNQKRIEKLLEKISIEDKNEVLEKADHCNSAKEYITFLENHINPINQTIHKRLEQIQKPFSTIGAQLQFDPKLEKKHFHLKMQINDQKNLRQLSKALEQFDYQEIENLWNGHFDV